MSGGLEWHEDWDLPVKANESRKRKRNNADKPEGKLQLEPIVNAGGINLELIVKFATDKKLLSLFPRLLYDGDFAVNFLVGEPPVIDLNTEEERYPKSDRNLLKPCLLNKLIVMSSTPAACCLCFTRPKPNGFKRLISQPIWLNKKGLKPPKFHLGVFEELLTWIKPLAVWYTVEVDFKNFYPQLSISENLGLLMGVRFKGKKESYRMQVLSQGWTWACICAQGVSWLILLYRLDNDDSLGLEAKPDEWAVPPPKLDLTKEGVVVGFICITYDNVLVITSDHMLYTKWGERIRRNCNIFNCVLKYCREEKNGFSYCGIQYERTRNSFQFRMCKEKYTEWKSVYFPDSKAKTLYAIISRLCYASRLRMEHTGARGRWMAIESLVGKHVANLIAGGVEEKAAWRAELPDSILSKEVIENLKKEYYELVKPAEPSFTMWPNERLWRGKKVIWCATDARPKILAFVIYDESSGAINYHDKKDIAPSDIDVAEGLAVDLLMQYILPMDWDICVLGLDNSCVGWSLHKGWSPSSELHRVTSNVLLSIKEKILVCVDIPSGENIADCPTRNEPMESQEGEMRRKATYARLKKGNEIAISNMYRLRWIHRSMTE